WAIAALVLMVLAAVYLLFRSFSGQGPGTAANIGTNGALEAIPAISFTDISTQAGIQFVHYNGASGEKLLPETMGGGCAFFDFDGDGDQDIVFVNGSSWPEKVPDAKKSMAIALYRNDGKGHFEDVTAGSGLEASFYGMGGAGG